jgi:hypothetical protein
MGALEDAQKQAEEMMKQMQQQAGMSGAGAANLAAAQAETDALKQQAAELDTKNDPAFAPIEGVAYDQYVALCVKMQPAGTDTAKQEEIAVANGLTKEQWKKVGDGFTKRCTENQQFARRLGMDVMAAAKG